MPPLGNAVRPVLVTALPASTGGGGLVRLSADGELYEDALPGWRVLRALDATNRLQLPLATSTSTPPADTVAVAARKTAGRVALAWKDPEGVEAEIQAAIWGNVDVVAGGSNAYGGFGIGTVTAGNTTAPATPAAGSYRSSLSRMVQTSLSTATSLCGIRFGLNNRWRGNGPGLGGFHTVFRVAFSALAGHQLMVGLAPTAALAGEPSAFSNSLLILGADAVDTNLQFMYRGSAAAATKIDLGIPKTTADVFRLVLYAPANAAYVGVQVWNESTASSVYEVLLTDNIPANTVFLAPHAQARNGVTTTATAIEVVRIISTAPTR